MAPKAIFSHARRTLSSDCEPPRYVQDNLGFREATAKFTENLWYPTGNVADNRLHMQLKQMQTINLYIFKTV